MKILVAGLPKSGTTILTYRIAGAIDDLVIEFEPTGGPDPDLADRAGTIVTKKLVGGQTATLDEFAHYDRRIWISRDPRDFLVSQTLYRWHREQAPDEADRRCFDRALASLLAKEANPAEVAFQSLDPADYSATFDAAADLWRREGDDGWLLYRYEDMVAGRYGELNRYLGFDVDPAASVASGLERVVRHKSAGDWRDWFTADDVAHYRAGSLESYMATFGYDHDDWAINPEPRLDPHYGSAYITTLFDDHAKTAADQRSEPEPEVQSEPRSALRPGSRSASENDTGPAADGDGATRRMLTRLLSRVR